MEERIELTKRRDALSQLAAGESVIKGIGSDTWVQLMRAAADLFSSQQAPAPFPGVASQDRCMLCQQVLPHDAHARLTTLWEFLNSEVSQKLERIRSALNDRLKELSKIPRGIPIRLDLVKDELAAEIPELWSNVSKFFQVASKYRDEVVASIRRGEWDISFPPADLTPTCEEVIKKLNADEAALVDSAIAAATVQSLQKDVAELNARKRAAQGAATIRQFHENAVRSAAFTKAAEQVNTRDLSLKVVGLQKSHIVEAFSASVLENVKQLGLRRIAPKINAKTVAGKVTQSVAVDGCKFQNVTPEQVFSEGERTVLALAYFLAESVVSAQTSGLIFDDPVTSMDHRYRSKVVGRLTELARAFQVIVFTHDLPFFCELRELAEVNNVPLQLCTVFSMGERAGVARVGEPYEAMKVSEQEKVLQSLIEAAVAAEQGGDAEGYTQNSFRFYSSLRASWERTVEEVVFNGVVQRFDKGVKTKSLRGVVVDDDALQQIFQAMSKCSCLTDAHDTAAGVNQTRPDTAEMNADLKALADFRSAHKKKVKQREEANKHLS